MHVFSGLRTSCRCWLYLVCFAAGPMVSATAQPDYAPYDELLSRFVSPAGRVDYAGLKRNLPTMRKVMAAMTAEPPGANWSREQQMAFWINAYNAYTLLIVAEHYPVSSIMEIDNGETWAIPQAFIGGRKYSLNEIENDILRSRFRDPRIHFALNCAAVACPPLMQKAYRPEILERQLEERTRQFIRSPANEITMFKARLSEIFKWYKADFGDPVAFINRYTPEPILAAAAISYIPYDWSLNE